jgi:hypothetical protein
MQILPVRAAEQALHAAKGFVEDLKEAKVAAEALQAQARSLARETKKLEKRLARKREDFDRLVSDSDPDEAIDRSDYLELTDEDTLGLDSVADSLEEAFEGVAENFQIKIALANDFTASATSQLAIAREWETRYALLWRRAVTEKFGLKLSEMDNEEALESFLSVADEHDLEFKVRGEEVEIDFERMVKLVGLDNLPFDVDPD